jgi:hypothetical protein
MSGPEDETTAEETTVAVYSAPDRVTAEIVRGALEAEGIPAVLGEQVADAYAGPLSVGEGYFGEIRVAAADAETARAVLAAYEAGQGQISDDDSDAAVTTAAADPAV